MKIEFRPDFKTKSVFKASWPRLLGAFKAFSFRAENARTAARTAVVLACACACVCVLALAILFITGIL